MEINNIVTAIPLSSLPLFSPSLNELFCALSKAQGQMDTAGKGSYNPVYKSYYADWETIKEVSREPLEKNALSVTQPIIQLAQDFKVVYTLLGHASGQFIASTWHINPRPMVTREGKTIEVTVQNEGAQVTYIKRYAYAAIIGLSLGEDDDGNTASGKREQGSNTTNDSNNDKKIDKDQVTSLLKLISSFPNATVLENNIKKFNSVADFKDLKQSQFEKVIAYIERELKS